jgi:Asp-tRNA(Asn)/Glu-tRNA(Gln) amidotransferase A subunit family amidase
VATGLDGEAVFRGFNQMREMAKATVAATLPYDFVISPTSPDVAYPAEWAMPSNDPDNAMAHIGFTVAYNMSEQPAVTVNCGYDHDGLPIGLQIVGRRFDDLGVLSAAMAFEAVRAGEARPWPEPPNQD